MSDFSTHEEKLKLAAMLSDMRNGFQAATEAIDDFLNYLGKTEQKGWNPRKIKWTKAEGSKGHYERADKQEGTDYKILVKELQEHDNTMMKDGFFYWLFDRQDAVGRKRLT